MNQSLICLGLMAECSTFVEEHVKHCHQNVLKGALSSVEEASWSGGTISAEGIGSLVGLHGGVNAAVDKELVKQHGLPVL